uniref:Uncharacterized protein n=1 Tax=Anguilla anguilla TaxID=7936 RepID=A0A0E9XVU6_ANGAN
MKYKQALALYTERSAFEAKTEQVTKCIGQHFIVTGQFTGWNSYLLITMYLHFATEACILCAKVESVSLV